MPRPVNLLTPDAPDNDRPEKQQRPPEMGSAIRVLPVPAKKRAKEVKAPVDDLDKDIYTAEKGIPPMPDEGPTKNVRKNPLVPDEIPIKGVKKYASGGMVSSASRRADGCAQRGKTRGKMV
jgi:hypothetical protein